MAKIIEIASWIMAHYQEILAALMALLTGLIAFFMIIPGEQPEKALKGFADFIAKFSAKKDA